MVMKGSFTGHSLSAGMEPRGNGGPARLFRWPVAVLLLALWCNPNQAQQATQFLPSIPGGAAQRLIYREAGFIENWQDPTVQAVFLAEDVDLDPVTFRPAFAQTGGVAVVRANKNFTITSGNITTEVARPKLNFNGMPNLMLVETGAFLQFNQVHVADIASEGRLAYTSTPSQPYINEGIGYGLWPSVAMAPGAQVYMINVSVSYVNPSPSDNCEQYTAKSMFGLRQEYGVKNVTVVNGTAGRLVGPVSISVIVTDTRNNRTGRNALALYDNVTFNCLERPDAVPPPSEGISPGVLAAAIAVPIVAVLAALLLACCCIRRRNLRRRQAALAEEQRSKDLEAGLVAQQYRDSDRFSDQSLSRFSGGTQGVRHSGSNPASSSSTLRNFLAIPGDTPLMDGILGTRYSVHSTGGSSGSSGMRRHLGAPGGAGSSGASGMITVGSMPLGMTHSSSQGVSTESSGMNRLSIDGRIVAAGLSSSAGGTDSSSMGAMHGHTGGTQGTGSGSGDRGGGSAGSGSGGRQTVAERYAGITSLLKARSDIAVLRELKIGPLLGRGSYGRVYRGRWKATTVAVKIIEHAEGAPGTASSGGKKISVGRESLLATSISHPNVVQTYHISTMTVAQRSALANSWLTDTSAGLGANPSGSPIQAEELQEQQDDNSSDDNNSHGSIEAQQKNLLETWMIMEFCEKGSLERAVNQGRFIRRSDKAPEMVGIYKALLDTASGLDYLHSIGVVHGDLKTANVLLKGSAKDPRGFMCKITDFGLSRVLDLDATHISTATYGTIVYMPKELLLSGRMTQATDIYSFGLMMWELYTSSRVFDEGLSIGQMFYMIAYQNWRPLIPTDCPPGFADLMTACWDETPEERPTAQLLLKRLQKLYTTAKQELAASRKAEAAAAGAGAAAAAAVLNGAEPGSAESGRSSQQAAAAGSGTGGGSAESVGARSGGSGGARAGPSRQTPKDRSALRTAHAPALAFPGSGSSMAESTMGALSPGASGGQVLEGSGGLGMSGLTVSGGGSDERKGLGSAEGDDELAGYKPYAAAVLARKRSGSLATGSAASGAYASAHRSSRGGRGQMQQLQQQQGQTPRDRSAAAGAAGTISPFGGGGASSPFGGGGGVVSPREAVGSGGTVPDGSTSEAFDDPIPYDDTMPSESVLQTESMLQNFTTDSNIQDGGYPADDHDYEDYSGYLGHPGGRAAAAAAQQGRGPGGAGPSSIEMSARPGAGRWAGAAGPQPGSFSQDQGPQPTGNSSSSSFSKDPFSSGYRDSFSTGTMPSVVADNWLGSQSSRSFAGSFGSSQVPSRNPSSMYMGSGVPPLSPTYASGASAGATADGGSFSEGTHGSSSPFAGQLPPAAVVPSRSYGTLQTVPENSGNIEGANSTSPGASREASAIDIRPVLAQQGPQGVVGRPGAGIHEVEEDAGSPQAVPAQAPLAPAQSPAGPTPSPFAALAQRAGSLFKPL